MCVYVYMYVCACVCVCVCIYICMLSCSSHVRLFMTSWTIACHSSLSMGFSRQGYCSRLPCPPSGDLPNPGMEPTSLMSPEFACGLFTNSAT